MGLLAFIMKKTRLSDITIDVDKDWQTKGITNIKQVAASMSKGDLVVRDTAILVRIPTGPDSYVLTSRGAGKLPTWQPPGGALKYYFPVLISLVDAEAIVTPNRIYNRNAPLTSPYVARYTDDPGSYIKRLDPTVSLVDAEAIATPDRTITKTPSPSRQIGLKKVVDGAVAHDEGVGDTDETAAAQNPTINDMTLLPAVPALNDAYYFGWNYPFKWIWLNISTAGVGNWALAEEYSTAAGWSACVDAVDGTSQFMASGLRQFSHTPQADWATRNVAGLVWYWVRYRVTNFVNITTQPKGAQAWCEKLI